MKPVPQENHWPLNFLTLRGYVPGRIPTSVVKDTGHTLDHSTTVVASKTDVIVQNYSLNRRGNDNSSQCDGL